MATQQEGEARQTSIGMIFSLMLQRKAKEFPDIKVFLDRIGMSRGSYYKLIHGFGNPTFYTAERTAEALGLTVWDLLGIQENVMRAWLAGQNLNLDRVKEVIETRRLAVKNLPPEEFEIRSAKPAPGAPLAAGVETKADEPAPPAPPASTARPKKKASRAKGK
jgi:transcriptional regulator with XRE-family HTH domain